MTFRKWLVRTFRKSRSGLVTRTRNMSLSALAGGCDFFGVDNTDHWVRRPRKGPKPTRAEREEPREVEQNSCGSDPSGGQQSFEG